MLGVLSHMCLLSLVLADAQGLSLFPSYFLVGLSAFQSLPNFFRHCCLERPSGVYGKI